MASSRSKTEVSGNTVGTPPEQLYAVSSFADSFGGFEDMGRVADELYGRVG